MNGYTVSQADQLDIRSKHSRLQCTFTLITRAMLTRLLPVVDLD